MLVLIALLGLISFSLIALFTILIWSKVNFSWLNKIAYLLVVSLPFEKIPSLDTSFGTLRLNQLLVLFGMYIFTILFIKKDKQLLQTKLNLNHFLLPAILILAFPSWFFVGDWVKFLVSSFATTLVFLAFFLISLFLKNPIKTVQDLCLVLLGVSFFGFYQLIADLAGLSQELTGLRDGYTKEVFGIARIHATAIEPQYFATMLFIPFFYCLYCIFTDKKVFNFLPNRLFNLPIFAFFSATILLTISKGAFLVLGLVTPFFIIYAIWKLDAFEKIKYLLYLSILGITIFTSLSFFSPTVRDFSQTFSMHVSETISFRAATSVQRRDFINTALIFWQRYTITGIGSGQYAHRAEIYLPAILVKDSETGKTTIKPNDSAIVNNVYLEVWVEFGFISFVLFLLFLIKLFQNSAKTINSNNFFGIIFLSVFLGFLLQWNFFSPIFIMPFFILFGIMQSYTSHTLTS